MQLAVGHSAGWVGLPGVAIWAWLKGSGNDLVAAEIAHVADLDHQIVARLLLDVEREVHAVRQLVGAVVNAECVRLATVVRTDVRR